jgi:ABC-type transport system involved in cytochrome c biogenesis permease subunit
MKYANSWWNSCHKMAPKHPYSWHAGEIFNTAPRQP